MKKKTILLLGICTLTLCSCGGGSTPEPTPTIEFTVTFNSNGGSSIPSQKIKKGDKVIKPNNPVKNGYNFITWSYKGEEWSFIEYSVTEDMTLDASWSDPISYNIAYNLNGGTNSPSNPSTYTIIDEITFGSPTKTGYSFVNWTMNGSPVTGISKGTTGNIMVVANWSINQYQVNVYTNDENKGTVSGGGTFDYGSRVTLGAAPVGEYVFNGWYLDSNYEKLLTKDISYTLKVPSGGISLYAKFWTKAEEEEENWNKAHGVIPVISEDEKTLTYGLYPQTHVSDSALITELEKVAPATDEEYFLYKNEYYVKDTGNPISSVCKFSDGITIISNETYYFKCEPIRWNIVGTGTNYIIDCSSILYGHRFDDNSNVYANSELRAWLNNDFYNKAFSLKSTASYIQSTDLSDVSVIGDKVWVGSKDQYDGTWYTSDFARLKKVSDFALCNNVYMGWYSINGHYWTRSLPVISSSVAWSVYDDGDFCADYVTIPYNGVTPALTIKI